MRLAVLNLTGGGASVGYLRYIAAILPRIAADPEVESVLCAAPAGLGLAGRLEPSPKIKFAECEPFRFLRHSPDARLAAALDAFSPDVVFVPLERCLAYKRVPLVTVLHNMAPLAGVSTGCGLLSRIKSGAQAYETRVALKSSAAVIAPTDYVKEFLTARAGVPSEKVRTINFGPSPLGAIPRRPAGAEDGVPFIFTAGTMEQYRGLEDLVGALPGLKAQFPRLRVAVGGGARPATVPYLNRLKAMSRANGTEKDISWLGKLSDQEMAWCYRNCSAFVMTSRLESFGFPALEAMQHGCACVSTASPCLPEIFGDAAVYYQAGDAPALAARLAEVLRRGEDERLRFSGLAVKRASAFSWDKAALLTLEVLKKAASAA